jgi:hypothetical protein
MKPEELISLAKAEAEMFERPARRTSCWMVEMIQVMVERIAELEGEIFKQSQESKEAVSRAIEIILEKDERIAELEKELSLTKDIIVAHQIADETGYIDGVGWVENWSEMEEKVSNLLEAHNLEQQAKGCFESILEIDAYSKNGSSFVLVRDVNNFGVKKQLQAEALKEQVK